VGIDASLHRFIFFFLFVPFFFICYFLSFFGHIMRDYLLLQSLLQQRF